MNIGGLIDELENQLGDDFLQVRIDYINNYIDNQLTNCGFKKDIKELFLGVMVDGNELPNYINTETYNMFCMYMKSYYNHLKELIREGKLKSILSYD